FLAKMATGYWNVMDPTNGFLALHTALLPHLDIEKIAKRYFFENDLLFRLGLVRAVVLDIPMRAHYGEEKSNLSVVNSLFTFPYRLTIRFAKRMIYRYFLRDFNLGSVLFLMGGFLFSAGAAYGFYHWLRSALTGQIATSGMVMIAALPVLLGFQMLGFALLFDVWMTPNEPVYPYLAAEAQAEASL
ncbi:MAG: glycosyltransferase family 2 protein, partial [Bdellovibrionota bacterium]